MGKRHEDDPDQERQDDAQIAETLSAAAPLDTRRALAEFTTEEIDAEYRRRHNVTFDRRTYMRDYMRKRRLTVVMPG